MLLSLICRCRINFIISVKVGLIWRKVPSKTLDDVGDLLPAKPTLTPLLKSCIAFPFLTCLSMRVHTQKIENFSFFFELSIWLFGPVLQCRSINIESKLNSNDGSWNNERAGGERRADGNDRKEKCVKWRIIKA